MAQHILQVDLPEVSPTGAPANDFQHIATSPDMFGALTAKARGLLGQGEQNLGAGLEKAGTQAITIATEESQLQGKIHAADVKSWYADQTTDMHSKFMALSGRAAIDALPEYKKRLGELKQEALGQVSGDTTKAMLGESLTGMQDQYYRYWSGHAGGQLKTYQDKVAQDGIASSSALAVNSLLAGDEIGFERRLREQDAEVINFYDGQGYAHNDMAAEVTKRRGVTLKTAIETVAAGGDVAKAQTLFDRYRDRMDPESVLRVTANLKSGVAQLQGRDLADEASGHSSPKSDSVANTPSSFISQVKRTEGYAPTARWDIKQFSNGYGTRAQFEGEQISRDEAEKRFKTAWTDATKIVDRVNPNLDPGTRAALSSLTYQTGDTWTRSGLGDAVRAGDLEKAKALFVQYNKVDGQTSEGVSNRRYREAQWFGANDAPLTNGPLADKQTAYERVLARTDNNPLLQTAAIARLNQVYGIYHTEQTNQNAAFDLRLKDTSTEALATGSAKNPLSEADFVNRYGAMDGPRRFGEYQKDLALGADMAGLAQMSPEDQANVLARHTPQPGSEGYAAETARQADVQKAIQHINKERDADPAAFAIRRLPAANGAFTAFSAAMSDPKATPDQRKSAAAHYAEVTLAEQARVGVPPADRKIVPQGYVDNLNASVMTPADAGGTSQVASRITGEAQLWGDRWPQVYRQLSTTAAPVVRVIGSGVRPEAAQILADVAPLSVGQILKDENTEKANTIKKDVLDAFKPLAASMAGQDGAINVFGDFRGQAEKLAARYIMGGMTSADAAAKAFDELVGFKYTFSNGYRVPKDAGVDSATVAKGTVAALRDLNPNDLVLPADDVGGLSETYRARAKADALRRDGKWVTSPDERGLALIYGSTAVRRRDGSPFVLTWRQLGEFGAKEDASARQFARDLQEAGTP